MIPIRDVNPSRSFPIVTIIFIIINVFIFLYELSLGRNLEEFFNFFALIPGKYFDRGALGGLNYLKRLYPFITSQFLHGGWMHLIGNMWFLWIFGDNIEDRLGHGKYILFYLLCGVAAGLTHVYSNPSSPVPTVGASGAIAGVMGAYTILYPRAKVLTFVFLFYFIRFIELPAFIFLGVWFVIQFFSGAATMASGGAHAGVAWWAHIGGFVVGIILVIFIPKKKTSYDRSLKNI